ncbi:hypothetical protein TSAR_007114 [Trichomalopsis sarcophagae]|uniref:Uncharacterized protein n=1 Tax=Trichomalopsis sarcophagae TaxID=543379 RepID=A0A232ERJ5_9HYME|nr:hypothetical protein TSAR_007114 [Trichomalopsis sarcophagae]
MEVKENIDDPDDIYIQPHDLNDFDKRKTYYAKWKCDKNCQNQHKHYEYKPCLIMFLADNENDIAFIEKGTRNRRPKLFSDELEPAPLKPTKPSVALNTKKMKEDMKRKTIALRSQSVLSLLKNKSNLENFNDTSDDDEEDKAESPKKRSKLNQTLFSKKFPELRVSLNRAQFDSQKNLDNEVNAHFILQISVTEELSDDGNSSCKTSNPNGPEDKPDQDSDPENVENNQILSAATNNDNNQGLPKDCTADLSANQQIRSKDTDNILQSQDNRINNTDNNLPESNENIERRNPILNQNNHTHLSGNPDEARRQPIIHSHVTDDPPLAHGSQTRNANADNFENLRNLERPRSNQPQDIITFLNNKSYKTRGDSIKLIIACCEYYIREGSPGVEDRKRRYQVTGDMVYLGEGLSVTSVGFNYMCKEPIKQFLRWLALEIWGDQTLMNRALQIERVNKSNYLPGRSPPKQIENELLRLFISIFHDYTEKRTDLPLEERTEALHNITVELSLIIRDLRTDYRKRYRRRLYN